MPLPVVPALLDVLPRLGLVTLGMAAVAAVVVVPPDEGEKLSSVFPTVRTLG